jgi:hypothetical protein
VHGVAVSVWVQLQRALHPPDPVRRAGRACATPDPGLFALQQGAGLRALQRHGTLCDAVLRVRVQASGGGSSARRDPTFLTVEAAVHAAPLLAVAPALAAWLAPRQQPCTAAAAAAAAAAGGPSSVTLVSFVLLGAAAGGARGRPPDVAAPPTDVVGGAADDAEGGALLWRVALGRLVGWLYGDPTALVLPELSLDDGVPTSSMGGCSAYDISSSDSRDDDRGGHDPDGGSVAAASPRPPLCLGCATSALPAPVLAQLALLQLAASLRLWPVVAVVQAWLCRVVWRLERAAGACGGAAHPAALLRAAAALLAVAQWLEPAATELAQRRAEGDAAAAAGASRPPHLHRVRAAAPLLPHLRDACRRVLLGLLSRLALEEAPPRAVASGGLGACELALPAAAFPGGGAAGGGRSVGLGGAGGRGCGCWRLLEPAGPVGRRPALLAAVHWVLAQ